MKIVLQRVREASVSVQGERIAAIGPGLLLLVAIEKGDADNSVFRAAEKIASLRIFADERGRMNLSIREVKGSILSVSQFTLAGDLTRGNRPGFEGAEKPELAAEMFRRFNGALRQQGLEVAEGRFGVMMEVALVNDGPVTFILEK